MTLGLVRRRPSLDRAPRWAVAVLCAAPVAAAALWAARPEPAPPRFAASVAASAPGASAADARDAIDIPDSVRTVSLRRELFPEPPKPDEPKPVQAQRLDLELVAIVEESGGEGRRRRAFVFDPSTNSFLDLGVGDTAPGGALVTAIEERAAVFLVGAAEVRKELAP